MRARVTPVDKGKFLLYNKALKIGPVGEITNDRWVKSRIRPQEKVGEITNPSTGGWGKHRMAGG